MKTPARHPIQPFIRDKLKVRRFKENAIVQFLLNEGPWDMNSLAKKDFSAEDREQFAQLIGYSVSGFADLSYVSSATWRRVSRRGAQATHKGAGRSAR